MTSRRILPFLLLIGILLRVAYLAGHSRAPEFREPTLDARWYHDRAVAWADGSPGTEWDLFRAPFYPLVLGQIYRVFGVNPWVPRLFHSLLGLGAILFIYGIGARAFGRTAGLLAAAIALFYAPFLYFEGELLVTTLYLFLILLAAWLAIRAAEKGGVLWAAAGLALGLAVVTRPTALVIVPFLILWQIFRLRRRAALPVLLFAAGIAAFPLVAAARNRALYGEFTLASQGGVNLYIGNNLISDGKTATVPGWLDVSYETKEYEDNVSLAATRIAEREEGRPLGPAAVSRHWTAKSLRWMMNDPGASLALFGRKLYYLMNGYEIPNNRFVFEHFREYAPNLLRFSICAACLIALGTAGMFLPVRRPAAREILAIFLAAQALGVVLFFVCARFRIPILPFWILFAAHFLARAVRERRRFLRRAAFPVAILLLVIGHTRFFGVDTVGDRHVVHFNRAWAFARTGDLERAEREYALSIEQGPPNPRALINYGAVLAERGKLDEAERAFVGALRIAPEYGGFVWNNLAMTRMLGGDWEGARRDFERALEADPRDPEVYINLGNVLLALERPEEAIARFDEAIRRGTARAVLARLGRAMALADMGRLDEAADEAEEAARSMPESRAGWVVLHEIARRAGRDETASEALRRFHAVTGRLPVREDLPEWWRD
ncbi:MAG: tetratricopeptide repeat protein [Candidatus Eisenbacteria bacterium]|nr:tetratricopeptide repeat protein [Candidatus Eisenbacteria bacterium]